MKKRTEYQYGINGLYIDEKENIITDRDPCFTPLPFCTPIKPKPPKDHIAIIADDKTTWEYVPDLNGIWWKKLDKSQIILSSADYEKDISEYTRKEPPCNYPYCIYSEDSADWIISESLKKKYDTEISLKKIEVELKNIDNLSLRALRSVMIATSSGVTPDPSDLLKLDEYESKANELRAQYSELQK